MGQHFLTIGITLLFCVRWLRCDQDRPPLFDPSYVLPTDQPLVLLEAKSAFDKLSLTEQKYAHFMSKASFLGGLIVLLQTSPEAPQIYRLIQRINLAQSPEQLREAMSRVQGLDEHDVMAYFVYCAGIYGNMGNYKGAGDTKFVPNMTPDKMELLVKNSQAWQDDPEAMEQLWESVKEPMWSLWDSVKQLGLGDKGLTTYFSSNCDLIDGQKVNRFLKANNLEGFNNRVFKTIDNGTSRYDIKNAAIQSAVLRPEQKFEDSTFIVTAGDFSELLQLVVDNLDQAKQFVANDRERRMLDFYIHSFTSGDLDAHKNGSREWIANKSPSVETYIGFIETYRDPMGVRGDFEGFVAAVNRDQSLKLQQLADQAEKFLPFLPWSADFEKDKYLRPDYTSLDVISFSGSLIPIGINIPNYNEIRQSEGFKNVNLGNVILANQEANQKERRFVSQADHELLIKYRSNVTEVKVSLHELLGHGSGKLFRVDADGVANYASDKVINPLTGAKFDPADVYQVGDTFSTKFASIGSSYEECRADSVAYYLCFEREVLRVFGYEDVADDLIYAIWLSAVTRGIKSLENFQPDSQEWKQAHARGSFAILQVILEAKQGLLEVDRVLGEDGDPDLLVTLDRSKLESVGRPALGRFLLQLQVFKSSANISAATAMYEKYTKVDNSDPNYPWLEWREIVLARRVPRSILVQSNSVLEDGKVTLEEFESSAEGMIHSWTQRFSRQQHLQIDAILEQLYSRDRPFFES